MKLHEQFLERAKQGNIDLLFIGNSAHETCSDNSPSLCSTSTCR